MLSIPAIVLAFLAVQDPETEVAPPAAAATTDERLRTLEARVDALNQQAVAVTPADSAPEAAGDAPMLRLYGFADMGLQRMMPRAGSALNVITPSNETTFVLGNLNVYFDAQPSDRWRALFEVRFTTYPNGLESACTTQSCDRQSTDVYDVNNASGGWSHVRWGGVVLERAHLSYRFADELTVRVGSFLTPFGIWNIDHGTPTLIALMLPEFEVNEMFPIHQLGVEVLGTRHTESWELGYFAYLSNGRDPGQLDFTDDKMMGARVFAARSFPFHMKFGLSALTGRYSDQRRVFVSPPYAFRRTEVVAYRETAGGADASIDVARLRLRAEFAIRRVDYDTGKRDLHYGVPGLYNADHLEWDTYFLAAYQLPWRLEPFVYYELYRYPTFLSQGIMNASVGLNIHFTAYAQMKLQYMHGMFFNLDDLGDSTPRQNDFDLIAGRLVLAF